MNEHAIYHKAKSNFAYSIAEDKIHVRLMTAAKDFDAAILVYGDKYAWQHKKEMEMELILRDRLNDYYQSEAALKDKRFSYYFKLIKNGKTYYFSDYGLSIDMYDNSFEDYFFHYPYINEKDRHVVPEWWMNNSACYQIFPERFCNGNPNIDPENVQPWGAEPTVSIFMGGDLIGIKNKIEYLRDLGVTTIYMTPFFKSKSNHKYDIDDFYTIDPHFGTNSDLKDLVVKAHKNGIKVVIDAVFNHSSVNFFAFQDVVKNGESSRYCDWFFIKEYPIDLEKIFTAFRENTKSAGIDALYEEWFYDKKTGEKILNYECFWSDPNMPKLNTANNEVKEYFINVGKYWIKEFDVDGWRLDVANEIDHVFWREFREAVKKIKPEILLLGEIWDNGEPWLRGDQFDCVMNYGLRRALRDYTARNLIGKDDFVMLINRLLMRNTDVVNQAMLNFLDTHDTERYLTTVQENKDLFIMSLGVVFTFVGIPMIYYGTEIGMAGKVDPGCRKCMDWNEKNWNREILAAVKKLTGIRKNEKALKKGTFRWIELHDKIVAFERKYKDESLLVIINNTEDSVDFNIPDTYSNPYDIFNETSLVTFINRYGFKIIKSLD